MWRKPWVRMDDAGAIFLHDRIRPTKDPRAEDLRMTIDAMRERLDESLPAEQPDFYAEIQNIPGLISNIGQAIAHSDNIYKEGKENVVSRIQMVTTMLEEEPLPEKELKKAVKGLEPVLDQSLDPMASDNHEEILLVPDSILGQLKSLGPVEKANAKERKRYEKEKAAYDKRIAKGKEAEEPAPLELADVAAIHESMMAELKQVQDLCQNEIDQLADKDYEKAAMLRSLENLQLEALSKGK